MFAKAITFLWRHSLARLLSNEKGGITIIGALSMVSLVGASALAVELGHGYSQRVSNQSVADAAALAGAISYMKNNNATVAFQAARDAALAANVQGTSVAASLVTSPRNAGLRAIKVDITTNQPLFLARILGNQTSIPIRSTATAEIGSSNPSCITVLGNSGTPINVLTSSSIAATDCSVAANGNIDVVAGSTISALSVESGGRITTQTMSNVVTTPVVNNTRQNAANVAKDPYAGNAQLAAEFAKIGTAQAPATAPTIATPPAAAFPALDSGACITSCTFQGKTLTKSGGVWYFPAGTYNFTSISVPMSKKIEFQGTASNNTNIYVAGNIDATFVADLKIGDGNVYAGGDLNVSTSSNVIIGNGRHYFRSIGCQVSCTLSIGNGDLDVINGIFGAAGVTITVGDGLKKIGGNVEGLVATNIIFGAGKMNIGGSLKAGASGTLTIGAATDHYINGNMEIATSTTVNLGAARYYVGGYVGGAAGATYNGTGVSIFAGGQLNIIVASSGLIRPPTADGTVSIDNIAFASLTTAASSLGAGGTAGILGTIYLPNSSLTISTSSSVGSTNECLLLIVKSISVVAGSSINTKCSNLNNDFKTQTISLVN